MTANADAVAPGNVLAKAKIFISYSRKDLVFVDRLDAGLRARGFEPLIDREEIYAFEDWWKRIEALIVKADTIVFVLSPDAVASDVCAKEVAFADSLNKRFAPVVCRRVDDKAVPAELRRLNFIFCDDDARFDECMMQLAEALETDIEWVRRHTDFGEQARRWAAAGRPGPRGLLLRSPALEDAEAWIASRPANAPSPTEDTQAFIAESRRAATRRRTNWTIGMTAGFVVALGLAGLALWQRGIAVEQQQKAEQQRGIADEQRRNAERQRKLAEEQRDNALRTQSLFLADLSRQKREAGDATTATLLALEALPDTTAGNDRPYSVEAEYSLDGALSSLKGSVPTEVTLLAGHQGAVSVMSSSDGSRILTWSSDSVRLWDVRNAVAFKAWESTGVAIVAASLSGDGSRVAIAYSDFSVRILNGASGHQIAVLKGHTGAINSVALNANGLRAVTASEDQTGRIWNAASGSQIGLLEEHREPLRRAAFSPDGSRVLTWSLHAVRLWDGNTGKPLALLIRPAADWLKGTRPEALSAQFASDGTRAFTLIQTRTDTSAGSTRDLRVWDAATGSEIVSGSISIPHAVTDIVVSPDGERFVSVSANGLLRLWNIRSGQEIAELSGHAGWVPSVMFSSDNKRIITASTDTTARIWDAMNGEELVLLRSNAGALTGAAFGPDRSRYVTTSEDGVVRIWSVSGDPAATSAGVTAKASLILPGSDNRVLFSRDGTRFVTYSEKAAQLWDSQTGAPIGNPLTGLEIRIVSFSPNGRRIVTFGPKRIQVWDAATGAAVGDPIVADFARDFRSVYISADSRRVLTVANARVGLWDAETGKPVSAAFNEQEAQDAVFSPNGKWILTASFQNTAKFWDAETGTQNGESLAGYEEPYVAFSSDGKRILTGGYQKARLWDAETRMPVGEPFSGDQPRFDTEVSEFSPDGRRVMVVGMAPGLWSMFLWDAATAKLILGQRYTDQVQYRFSSDGKRLLLMPGSEAPHLIDLETTKPLGPIKGRSTNGAIAKGVFSANPMRLLTLSDDPTPQLWDYETAALVAELKGHDDRVGGAAFSEDGKRIVTASSDKTLRLWNAVTGKPLAVLQGHTGQVYDATFNASGTKIVSRGGDGVRLWHLSSTQGLVDQAKIAVPRCLYAKQRRAFFLPPEPPAWCIEMEKWPYHTAEWKRWLADSRVGKSVPLPAQ